MRTQADWYDLKPSNYRKGAVSYHAVRCRQAESVLHGRPVKSKSQGLLYMTAQQGRAVLYLHAHGWKPAETADGLHGALAKVMKVLAGRG